jgi:hypothetical protein
MKKTACVLLSNHFQAVEEYLFLSLKETQFVMFLIIESKDFLYNALVVVKDKKMHMN